MIKSIDIQNAHLMNEIEIEMFEFFVLCNIADYSVMTFPGL